MTRSARAAASIGGVSCTDCGTHLKERARSQLSRPLGRPRPPVAARGCRHHGGNAGLARRRVDEHRPPRGDSRRRLVVCGVALTIGIFTPFAARSSAWAMPSCCSYAIDGAVLPRLDGAAAVVGLAAAAALGLLGPGAFSIDARLFGRREIFIPAKDGSDRTG